MLLVGLNENLVTFLYTFEKRGQEIVFFQGGKSFLIPLFQKCIEKLKCQRQQIWNFSLIFNFMYLDRTIETNITVF